MKGYLGFGNRRTKDRTAEKLLDFFFSVFFFISVAAFDNPRRGGDERSREMERIEERRVERVLSSP